MNAGHNHRGGESRVRRREPITSTETAVQMSPLGSKITIRPRGMGVVDGTATVHVEVKFEGPIALKLLTVGRGRQRRTPAPLLGGAATTASRATPSS